LQIIRYSLPITLADELYLTQSKLAEEVPHLDLQALTHVALSGTNILLNNEILIRAIAKRLTGEISNIRIKDMERYVNNCFKILNSSDLNGKPIFS